jgi:hypothetical protein
LSFSLHFVLCTLHWIMKPTHLSNTAPFPTMENTRGIWSTAAGIGAYGDDGKVFHFHHCHHCQRYHRIAAITLIRHRDPAARGKHAKKPRKFGDFAPFFAAGMGQMRSGGLQESLQDHPQAADAFDNPFGAGVAVIQAEGIVSGIADEKVIDGHEGHVML